MVDIILMEIVEGFNHLEKDYFVFERTSKGIFIYILL